MADYHTTENDTEFVVWVPSSHSDDFRRFLINQIGLTFDYNRNVFSGEPAGANIPEGEEFKYAMDRFTFPKPEDVTQHDAFESRLLELIEQFTPPAQ